MAAVHVLRMQPYIRAAGGFCRELVVLAVAAADEYQKAVGGDKLHRPLLFELIRLCAALLFYIAGLGELAAYLRKVALCLRALELVKDAV